MASVVAYRLPWLSSAWARRAAELPAEFAEFLRGDDEASAAKRARSTALYFTLIGPVHSRAAITCQIWKEALAMIRLRR